MQKRLIAVVLLALVVLPLFGAQAYACGLDKKHKDGNPPVEAPPG